MDRSNRSTPTPTEPTYSTQDLDRGALALEKRIFLSSDVGRALTKMLARSLPGTAQDDFANTKPFEKLTVRRGPWGDGWVISGLIGETIYNLAVTDVEIQYSNLV